MHDEPNSIDAQFARLTRERDEARAALASEKARAVVMEERFLGQFRDLIERGADDEMFRLARERQAARDAALEDAARAIEPSGDAPCDCEGNCYCGNFGNVWVLADHVIGKSGAAAIRAMKGKPAVLDAVAEEIGGGAK